MSETIELEVKDGLLVLAFAGPQDFEAWVVDHAGEAGLWLKIAKKASGIVTVTYAEALEVALCYGWIDGLKQSYDEAYFLQKFTPRRPKSVWSKINVGKVEALIAAGRMKPSGLAVVEAAKADGRWDQAYDGPRTMTMPDDFAAALEVHPRAQAFWETLNKTNTFAFLWQLQTAKRAETRAARIEKFVAMLEAGEKLH